MTMKPLLHPSTKSQVDGVVQAGAGGYIFHGRRSMGKSLTAQEVARRLNCQGDGEGECAACHRLRLGTYPDYIVVRPEEKPSITIEQIRRLVQALSLSPYHAKSTRIVVIDDADLLTTEAQNALLKLIEEPPTSTRFILVATQVATLLPTVRSRLGSIFFAPIETAVLAKWLETVHGLTPARANLVASEADGVPGAAILQLAAAASGEELDDGSGLAASSLSLSRFERLQASRGLVERKADLAVLAARMHRLIIERLRLESTETAEAAAQLRALELFRRQLDANVSPKVALDCLMLAL